MKPAKYILAFVFLLSGIFHFLQPKDARAEDSLPSLAALSEIYVKENLKADFFPVYLRGAYQNYLKSDVARCRQEFSGIKLTLYSDEPAKYYLLDAICQDLPAGPERNIAVTKLVASALREKASSSDILFASGLVLAENKIFDQALQKFTDGLWFKEFSKISLGQFYFNMAQVQFSLSMFSEANGSLLLAEKAGFKSDKFSLLMLEAKLILGDRRNAIELSRNLRKASALLKKSYLIRSLILSADPTYHRKELIQAAALAREIGAGANSNPDLSTASIKALLYDNDVSAAKALATNALVKYPSESRILSLMQQIENEEKQKEIELAEREKDLEQAQD